MSAINYLTLVSTIIITASGTPVPPGYINIASTNSAPTWANSISTNGIQGSTIVVSSITTSTITVSTLGYSTISGSTISAQNISLSTLTVSSINNGTPGVAAYSTFNASSINVMSTITTSSLTTSSLTVSAQTSLGNRLLGLPDASPTGNFWVGLRGSGTEGDRLAIALQGNQTTGAVSQITLNKNTSIGATSRFIKLGGSSETNYYAITGNDTGNSPYTEYFFNNIRRGYVGAATATNMPIVAENGAQLNLFTEGVSRMVIDTTGNVGIGIATPDAPLHIYKSVSRSYTSSGSNLDVQFAMTSVNGGRWYLGHNQSVNSNLYFIANVNTNSFTTLDVCAFIENDTAGTRLMNFTGQHRCSYDDTIHYSISEGLIVRATGTYWSLVDNYENTSPIDHITINESLPQITLVREANCPSVFGAVSFTEDTNSTRKNRAGRFTSVYANPFGEKKRVFVNALGEGGVWVCNINGNFTLGDLITTSIVPGYGMLQSSNQIVNYTFGKITMDCDFQPTLLPVLTARTKQESKTTIEELLEDQITEEKVNEVVFDEETQRYVQKTTTKQTTKQVPLSDSFLLYDESGAVIGKHTIPRKGPKTIVSTVEDLDANGNVQWDPSLDANGVPLTKPAYQLRYLDADGTILTKEQYDTRIQNGQPAYLAAFVGCIYQCG